MPEYLPWYHPGSQLLRCGGDNGCAALIVEGDIELHNKWHTKVDAMLAARPAAPIGALSGPVCTSPDCGIPRKPGRPAHGPHDFRAGKVN